MDNKPFVEAYQDINERMIRLVGSMSALRELSSLELSINSETELLDKSLRILLENHELDYVVIYLSHDGELQAQVSRVWEENTETLMKPVIPLLKKLAEESFVTASIKYNREIEACDSACSALCLPLSSGEDKIGTLCAFYPEEDFFTQSHERNLQIYCNFLAQSLITNRLLMKMDDMVRQRTEQLQTALNEARELKQRYEELSIIDELTGLHNRRFFFPESRAVCSAAIRYQHPISMLMFDIDRFKLINDMHGHAMGDTVLKDLAKALQDEKREPDILVRFGGEEFIILLPETDQAGAMVLAERIQSRVKQLRWKNDELSVTASFGIASYTSCKDQKPRELLDTMIKQADAAMYHSKENGRDQIHVYDEIGCAI